MFFSFCPYCFLFVFWPSNPSIEVGSTLRSSFQPVIDNRKAQYLFDSGAKHDKLGSPGTKQTKEVGKEDEKGTWIDPGGLPAMGQRSGYSRGESSLPEGDLRRQL